MIRSTVTFTDHITSQPVTPVTKFYYDACGNKIKMTDPNYKDWLYEYTARGWLKSEVDPLGNTRKNQYDVLGNKTAVTDPRGNGTDGSFTTYYQYDDLNRLTKTILPDNTPGILTDNPYIEITYDNNGNKLSERDPNGVLMEYTYTLRNWVETVTVAGQLKITYTYDKKGNQTEVKDALNHTTINSYDSLGRLRKVQHPAGNYEEFAYDAAGNRVQATDGRHNTTQYMYNSLGMLTGVRDPLYNLTQYQYDLNGNKVKAIAANNLEKVFKYDEMNRLWEQVDSLGGSTKYSYDVNGNRSKMTDRRESLWTYHYLDNNLLRRLDVSNGGESYYVEYTYDAAGNRTRVQDTGNDVKYNLNQAGVYQPDPLNRINQVKREFGGAAYTTGYQYNSAGQVIKIKYPEALDWLEYNYDTQNRLSKVVGFTAATDGITYNADNSLASMTYYNGAVVSYGYDSNSRLSSLQASRSGDNILDLDYTYDDNNNITVNDKGKIKTYVYDENNQLIQAVTPDKFLAPAKLNGASAQVAPDFKGASWMDYMQVLPGMMGLDYHAKSIGIDFGVVIPKLKQIKLVPGEGYQNHRITENTLDLYTSSNNSVYSLVTRDNWEFAKNSETGVITITFSERISTRYLKVHVKFDDRDIDGNARDSAQFLNELAKMMEVYQEADSRTEEYQYDAAGNRKLLKVTLVQTENYYSYYYTNSDRLKTDGKYAFDYDAAGNLIRKGNRYEINGDMVTFTTVGEGVEFWEYEYDLLNRLIEVRKNGNIVSEYAYNPEGLRVVKRKYVGSTLNDTTHYVFEGTEPIFEKRISDSRVRSYVFALGKHLARVDGVIGDANAEKYWYHTDHVGSVRAVSNDQGQVVWKADYLAFGSRYGKEGTFDEERGFTGKEFDVDTGLNYYNARWYDSETGRFISEDPKADPNNPNLYSYCANNPLINIDLTGCSYDNPSLPSSEETTADVNAYYNPSLPNDNSTYDYNHYSPPLNTNPEITNSGESSNNETPKKPSSLWDNIRNALFGGNKSTDNTSKNGPVGKPIGYVYFPSGLKLPVYSLDQLPESEQGKYINLANPSDRTIIYVPPGMENTDLSEHFTVREFMSDIAKKDSFGNYVIKNGQVVKENGNARYMRLDPNLINQLETIRAENGNKPMSITEGYRSADYNRALIAAGSEASKTSPHTAGVAADFHINGITPSTIQGNILSRINNGIGVGRVGLGVNNTHYDIADKILGPTNSFYKTGATWGYTKGF